MQSAILKKIIIIIMAVALISIILAGLMIHFALNRQFHTYLLGNEEARQEQVVRGLAELYENYGGWENLPPRFAPSRNNFFGTLRFVLDEQERVVLASRGLPMLPNPNSLTARPIYVAGAKVGTAYFGKTLFENLLTAQDRMFRTTINRSILGALLLTGILSFLVALLLARRISDPITEMNRTARAMTAGQLDSRVQDLPRDELGELGASLNRLAERLKETNELRKKMTADVAHDLRTPLATVRSHLEGMIDQVIPASPENLESLLDEVKRLTTLVADLQEIAQADVARYRFNLEPLALEPFLAGLVQQMTPLFQKKKLRLALRVVQPATVRCDRDALTKVMENLLSNAHKYTPSGGNVTVLLEREETQAVIAVQDEGIGIAAADLPYVFERFYRTDQSRNRESGGFGLGLTIVKELVEGLGGSVTAQSTPGAGSCFTVRLPLLPE
ncbi:histidine kinase [Hydrogenispora ethanolica]|uniref:histidine kinase n=1 Tax=Hydrogenispora ethanolica TaxID=1082276 RepID=A0A4R1S018_HYDET|nr:ATP-binding protein [Hydrogenispora ethanolica]TCL72418.1 histidine kinase [Hydrogenispora ethanolica]